MVVKQDIEQWLASALKALLTGEVPPIVLERPQQVEHGDYACHIAFLVAKLLKMPPHKVAQRLIESLAAHKWVASIEIAGPGFLNILLSEAARRQILTQALEAGPDFAKLEPQAAKKILLEYVSANPTGPLHVGHARQGVIGDILSRVLSFRGYVVHREFFYNNAGNQIEQLAASVQARAKGLSPDSADWPQDGYCGEYIQNIAQDFIQQRQVAQVVASGDTEDIEAIRCFAVAYLEVEQREDLNSFGVAFDQYYLESDLYQNGSVGKVIERLNEQGSTYEAEGALWLKASEYGDDKDRVMRKSNGGYTYFVPDVAYHVKKWQRGFKQAVNIQGFDHHGTVARVRAGLQALDWGISAQYPQYILHKMVTVLREGKVVKLSKRAGNYVTVRDLVQWVGADAVRFFLASRKADTEFSFDVDLARQQNDENPVYYVQYAYARMCSVLRQWGGDTKQLGASCLKAEAINLLPLRTLVNKISDYPEVLLRIEQSHSVHWLIHYARELASQFHVFYNQMRILVDDSDQRLANLSVLWAVKQVLQSVMGLIGIRCLERM